MAGRRSGAARAGVVIGALLAGVGIGYVAAHTARTPRPARGLTERTSGYLNEREGPNLKGVRSVAVAPNCVLQTTGGFRSEEEFQAFIRSGGRLPEQEQKIQAIVERVLKEKGVPLAPQGQSDAILEVRLVAKYDRSPFQIQLMLFEKVRPERDPGALLWAPVWRSSETFLVEVQPSSHWDHLKLLPDHVRIFAADYCTANPPSKPTPQPHVTVAAARR